MSFDLNAVGMPGEFSGPPAASSSSAADQDAATFQAFMEQHALDLLTLFSDAGVDLPPEDEPDASSAAATLAGGTSAPAGGGDDRDASSPLVVPGTLASLIWLQAQPLPDAKPEAPPAEAASVVQETSLDEVALVLDVPESGTVTPKTEKAPADVPPTLSAAPFGDAVPVIAPPASEPEAKTPHTQKLSEGQDAPSDAPVDLVKLFLDRAPFLKPDEDEKDGIERSDQRGSGPKVRGPLDGATDESDEATRSSELDEITAADAAAALAAAAIAATPAPSEVASIADAVDAGVENDRYQADSVVALPSPDLPVAVRSASEIAPSSVSLQSAASEYVAAPVLDRQDAPAPRSTATNRTPIDTTNGPERPVFGESAPPPAAAPDNDASTLAVTAAAKSAPGTRASVDARPGQETVPVADAAPVPASVATPPEDPPADKAPARFSADVARAFQSGPSVEVKLDLPLRPGDIQGIALSAASTSSGAGSEPGTSSDSSSGHPGSAPRAHGGEHAGAIAHRLAQTVQLMAGFERVLESTAMGTTSAPVPPPFASEPRALDSIVKSMRLQHQGGGGTAVIQLDPEFLGDVTVSLQLSRGAVTATLQAGRADVRAWLEANEGTLREALKQQGLSLDRLVVTEDRVEPQRETSADGRRRESQAPPSKKPRRQRSGDAVTFEVVV